MARRPHRHAAKLDRTPRTEMAGHTLRAGTSHRVRHSVVAAMPTMATTAPTTTVRGCQMLIREVSSPRMSPTIADVN